MNIIQLQDRLKGMPEEVLIGYVQTPTGEAPTYLVLSELERRKVMREKYAGQQEPTTSVAEQIVSESMTEIMPQSPMAQGIATGMPPQGMPPAAPQEMMPESIEEVGIAANPTPNIGQNYNVGGVVGYAKGDIVLTPDQIKLLKEIEAEEASGDTKYKSAVENLRRFSYNYRNPNAKKRVAELRDNARPIRGQSNDEFAVQQYLAAQSPAVNSAITPTPETLVDERAQELNNKFNPSLANNYSGSVEEALQSNYPKQQISQEPIDTNLYEPVDQDNLIAQQRQAYYDSIKDEQTGLEGIFGIKSRGDFYEGERNAIQAERDKYAGDKDSALNMALINAGLGIASGTSSNFLENVATGAMPGITSYTQDMKDMRAQDKLFDKEMRTIDRGERAEGRADLTEYKTNELALRKIAATSGLTQSEYATISKDAKNSSLDRFKQVYGDFGAADSSFAGLVDKNLSDDEKTAKIFELKTKALDKFYEEDFLTAMNRRVLANNSGYSATPID
jgi:hypothetical protein